MSFVILLRHGIAHPRGSMPEATRGLTKTGHARMKENARGIANLVEDVDAIYSSPLLRCRQTAEYVAACYEIDVEIANELRPDAGPRELRRLLPGRGTVICVGHEPVLSAVMLDLTGMTANALELKKGGCYGVRIDGDETRLEWMLAPKVLRQI